MRNHLLTQFTLRNLAWALASIFLAMVIWIAANMANNPVIQEEMDNVSVRIELPEGFVVTDRPDSQSVTAVVRAPRNDWNLMVANDILVTADLSDIHEPGEYRIELEAEVAEPLNGNVVALRPSTWTLTLDYTDEVRLPIEVIVTETPPMGYTYSHDFDCDVSEVIVRGSEERVANVAGVQARLDLSDALNPVTLTANLIPVQENALRAREVELSPSTITCTVDIQVREGVTPVEVLPDRGGTTPPRGYTFQGYSSIEPRRVGLTGDADMIATLNSVIRTEPIDLSGKTETFTTDVPLVLPEGVSLVEGDELVRVTVLITPVFDSREFTEVPIEIVGLDTSLYHATGLAGTVTVNVSGPQATLPDLDVSDIRVTVNLLDLPPGNHQITPDITIIGQTEEAEFEVSSVLPEQLNVTIEALSPTGTPAETPDSTAEPAPTPTANRN